MASVTNYPASAFSNTHLGSAPVAWQTPANATGSNTTDYAYAVLTKNNDSTQCLDTVQYGFFIPVGSTINGILVEIYWGGLHYDPACYLNTISLLKAGNHAGGAKGSARDANPAAWVSYGSSTDLWGTSWTPAEINAANFGVTMTANYISQKDSAQVDVHAVRITVYYTPPANATFSGPITYPAIVSQTGIDLTHPTLHGCVGWWKGWPSHRGSRIIDVSVTRAGALLYNMDPLTDWVNSPRGAVLDLDGVNDYAQVAVDSSIHTFLNDNGDGDKPFSVMGWAYMRTLANFTIISKGRDNSNIEYLFGCDLGGYFRLGVYDQTGMNQRIKTLATTNSANQYKWAHYAATYDGLSASGIKLYINGIDVGGTATTGGTYVRMRNLPDPPYLGARTLQDASNAYYSSGQIDDVRLYSIKLSPQEIREIYLDTVGGRYAAIRRGTISWALRDATTYQTINDKVGETDSAGKVAGKFQTLTDSIGVVDPFGKTTGYAKGLADSLGITDSITDFQAWVKILADQVGITDATSSVSAYRRTASDVLGIADPLVTLAAYTRQVADGMGLADSTVKSHAHNRETTDLLGLLDGLVKLKITVQAIVDSVGLTEAVVAGRALTQNVSDAVGMVDSIAKTIAFAKAINDVLTTTDSLSRITATYRAVNDTLGLNDLLRRASSYTQRLSDNVSITDDVSWLSGLLKTIDDTVGTTDSLERQAAFVRALTDYLGITDEVIRGQVRLLMLSDTIGLSDSVSKSIEKLTFLAAWYLVTQRK